MISALASQFGELLVPLVIAGIVWAFYKGSTSAPADRYATFWPRFWTGSIDGIVLWPLNFLLAMLFALNNSGRLAALLLCVQSLACVAYTVVMHARYGQTVGKMVTQVRVVDFETEERITLRQAAIREGIPFLLGLGLFAYIECELLTGAIAPQNTPDSLPLPSNPAVFLLSTLPIAWLIAEVLTMLTNKKRRALHDFIAGTAVVRTNTVAEPTVTPAEYPEDYLIKCMRCGHSIPAFETVCGKCGWTYKEEVLATR